MGTRSGTRQVHFLLISSGDSCLLTEVRSKEEGQTGKKYFQFVVIASVMIENILALQRQTFSPVLDGRGGKWG